MQPSDEDSRPDELSQTPGPGWSLSLIYRSRTDSNRVGLMFGLVHERREFDVDFAGGGLGGGSYGNEYVRLNTAYIIIGLNVRLSERGAHWLRPTLALRSWSRGLASGWSQGWSIVTGPGIPGYPRIEYRDEERAGYAAPIFAGLGWGITGHLGDRWLIDVEPNASISVPLPAFVHESALGTNQYQIGVRMAFGLTVPRLFGPRLRAAFRKDREQRIAPADT
ncbi:MAG: hypothetical protein WAU70_07275 [Flavobacteriales bacterium]